MVRLAQLANRFLPSYLTVNATQHWEISSIRVAQVAKTKKHPASGRVRNGRNRARTCDLGYVTAAL